LPSCRSAAPGRIAAGPSSRSSRWLDREPKEKMKMPFYTMKDLKKTPGGTNPLIEVNSAVGELMKVAIVTKPEGEGPPLHEHPNEEQFSLILEGEMHFILGDEDRVVGPGTLVHIPRNTPHRSRPVNGPCTFFAVKSPAGDGRLHQDYKLRDDAEAAEALYPGRTKK
jgi:quercetin dioxygenase-like cupin family protein